MTPSEHRSLDETGRRDLSRVLAAETSLRVTLAVESERFLRSNGGLGMRTQARIEVAPMQRSNTAAANA